MDCVQLSLFGRTYQEPFPATTEKTSGRFWKNLPALTTRRCHSWTHEGGRWSKAGAITGNGWSLAWRQLDSQYFGVAPAQKAYRSLSLDLEVNAPEKYYLSARACQGILTRASRRGKKLPELLQTAFAGNGRVVGAGGFCTSDGGIGSGRAETEKAGKAGGSEREERTPGRNSSEAAAYSLKIRSGWPEAERALLCKQKKSGHYRHSRPNALPTDSRTDILH